MPCEKIMRKIGKMRKTHMCEISVSELRWAASTSRAQFGSDGQLTKTFSVLLIIEIHENHEIHMTKKRNP